MTIGEIGQWASVAVALAALLCSAIAMREARSRREKAELEKMKRDLDALQQRIEFLPGNAAIDKLTSRFETVSGQLSTLHGDFQRHLGRFEGFERLADGLQRQFDLIDGFLRERGQR
ncbi:MAG: hypothetical protein RIB84_22500 [Sneathiellaceae bacterium]